MMTKLVGPEESFGELLQHALLVHNAVPHVSTGESPFYLLTGMDPAIPGWALFTRESTLSERLIGLKEKRFYALVQWKLKRLAEAQASAPETLKEGDVVIYEFEQLPNHALCNT